MPVPMPAVVVLIVCKTIISGPADQNSSYTGYENREWATEHSMMVCRRHEIQVEDMALMQSSEASPVTPRPFTIQQCQKSAIQLGVEWDAGHRGSAYRFWRSACPVPIVDTRTGETIGWKLPECGHKDTIVCLIDSEV